MPNGAFAAAGLLVIAASTYVLYLLVGTEGVLIDPDSHLYVGSAINLLRTGDLAHFTYEVESGFHAEPLTHYPPLMPLCYALLMVLGVAPSVAPIVMSLLGWPVLLAGVGVLAYRLSRSRALAVLAVVPLAFSYDLLSVFRYSKSEVIFLPLLVWAMASLVDLPRRRGGAEALKGWAVASALLASLMLTRYPGGFVWLAAGAWWAGWRLWQGRLLERSALKEGALLAAAVVPLGLWLARNVWLTESAVGAKTMGGSAHSFVDGARAVALWTFQSIWPTVRSPHLFDMLGLALGALLYALPLAVVAYGAWRYRARLRGYLFRSPVEVFLFIYLILLYVLAQAFLDFYPLNGRDMATASCLLVPWIVGGFAVAPRRVAVALLGTYGVLCVVFIGALTFRGGESDVVRISPPEIRSLAGGAELRARYTDGMFPNWLVLQPHTSRALARYHGGLRERLGKGAFVITNDGAGRFFTPYDLGSAEEHPAYPSDDAADWLARGRCTLPEKTVVVLLAWDRWEEESRRLEAAIDRQCPQLSKETFEHSVLYAAPGEVNQRRFGSTPGRP